MNHKEAYVATSFSRAKSSPEETTAFMGAAPVKSVLVRTTVCTVTHRQKLGDDLLNLFKT